MEDYEKKYKEALEKIIEGLQPLPDGAKISGVTRAFLEEVFPELAESEDEKIRKGIIDFLWKEKIFLQEAHSSVENNPKYRFVMDAISWLEKQGKQNPTDKVEPKFKVGDWVVYTGYLLKDSGKESYVMQVASVEDDRYNFTDTSTLCFDSEKDMRSWTIQDAKDGDVLVDVYGNTGIFQKNDDFDWTSYCSLGCNGGFQNFKVEHESENAHPATKEQRDILIKAMTDAGYTFDLKKKELKKIEQKPADKVKPRYSIGDVLCDKSCTTLDKNSQPNIEILDIRNDMYICNNCTFPISQQDEYELVAKRIEPQPAWSEEDKYYREHLLGWISSLKNYIHYDALVSLEKRRERIDEVSKLENWLKSLKD